MNSTVKNWSWACEPAFTGFPKEHVAIFNELNQTLLRSDYLSPENAAFIVRSVNLQDQIIEALKKIKNLSTESDGNQPSLNWSEINKIAEDAIYCVENYDKIEHG